MAPKHHPHRLKALTVAFLVVALISLSCTVPSETNSGSNDRALQRPNVLLISIDTLRADHLGSYGYPRDTTPNLDALAAGSIRFKNAFAPTPWTLPSHAAMLTGMHPYRIGIDNSRRKIPDEIPTVAELLSKQGYQTGAIVDSSKSGFVGALRGFSRGFESYQHAPHKTGLAVRFDMKATVEAAHSWLDRRDLDRPFFLFLHTKTVHAMPNNAECLDPLCFPYDQLGPHRFRFFQSLDSVSSWCSKENFCGQEYLWSLNRQIASGKLDPTSFPAKRIEELRNLYDAGLYYVDEQIGHLLNELEDRELGNNTVVIVTSDHGESFLDHQLFMHQEVYDATLRVPLIVRLPPGLGGMPGTRKDPVGLADIGATLLQLGGAGLSETVSGLPLPLIDPEEYSSPGRGLFSYYLFPELFDYQALAFRQNGWKLVLQNVGSSNLFQTELYDLSKDPGELYPVAGQADRKRELRSALMREVRRAPLAQSSILGQPEAPESKLIRSLAYVE